ncbi:tetratricopeptide repeat protein [Phytomonospora sp. NPDC050363]|uniref:ATP-binding protein n=1 Tax=Phytomonospora sp. NPDC050363 TaxID=3155642 RepID=UPI0033DAA2D9
MPDGAPRAGRNLRPLRLRAAMTQEELGLKAGVGTRTIRDIESGKVRPQPRTLRLLAEALGLGDADRALLTRPAGSPEATAPRELPRALTAFTGRQTHLDAIVTAVGEGTTVVALHGMAGVGKTSLAVWAAHALTDRYPDGQLFVDLHGFTGSVAPRPSLRTVLTRVLRALGVPCDRDTPIAIDELTARYRTALADRRILLVFDNVANAAQLEALLPATPGGLVLATSRRDLSPLAGAHSVRLEPPPAAEAAAMLTAAVPHRVTDEQAVLVAERCGRLPLAIGLAAARLRSRPQWQIEDLLARFADEGRLLDELDMDHQGVATALRASYLELDTAHRRLLRRLGLIPGDDLDAHAAAALCGAGEKRAAAMMESLVDVHLVETRSPGRYRLHDLVRLFAARLARLEETAGELDEALRRLIDVYLHFAFQGAVLARPGKPILFEGARAHDLGLPGFADQRGALSWFQAERGNLEAAVTVAERAGLLEQAWQLAAAFNAFDLYDSDRAPHTAVARIALDIAVRLDDRRKEGYALGFVGRQLMTVGRQQDAIDYLSRAVALKRDVGEVADAALTLVNIAMLHRHSGRFTEAVEVYREALALIGENGESMDARRVSLNMVAPLLTLGRLEEAERILSRVEEGLAPDDAHNRTRLDAFRGVLARRKGDPATAVAIHTVCLEDCRRRGLPHGVTSLLLELGEDLLRLGRHAEAVAHLGHAVECAEEQSDRFLERATRNALGRALTAAGDPREAIGQHERVALLAESADDVYELARAHHGLAEALRRSGDPVAARRHRERAARGYAECAVPEAEAVAEQLGGN